MRAASEFDAAEAAERSSTITVLKRGLTEADVANTDLEAQISTADVEITRMLAVEETLMTRVNVLSEQVAAAEEALQESSAHGHEHDVEPRERLEAAADLKERYGSMRKQYQARIAELEAQLEDDGRQTSPAHRPYSRVKELELELQNSAAAHRSKIAELEEQVLYAEAVAANGTPQSLGKRPSGKFSGNGAAKKIADLQDQVNIADEAAETREGALVVLQAQFSEYKATVARRFHEVNEEREAAVSDRQRLLTEQVLRQDDDSSMMLQRKVESLEKVIDHLNERLVGGPTMETVARYDAQLRERDRQMDALHEKLALARKHHSPTLVHFERIESTVVDLETRLRRRDRELESLTAESKFSSEAEISACDKRWQIVVAAKQTQIDKFRLELDKILEAIRLMQQQGVRFQVPIGV
eukprot:m.182484 g.182484  ORF g.182484 m.182484 type:complete len:414 (-) comp24643_c0_seq4:112-1353(-)